MGMRASIALVDASGTTRITSVQWATMLPANLAAVLSEAEDKMETIKDIFVEVTKFDHISAVEADTDNSSELGVFIEGAQEHDGFREESYKRPADIPGGSIEDFHLDDGIGAIYDERDAETVTFFFRNEFDEVVFAYYSLEALADEFKETGQVEVAGYPFGKLN